MADVSPLSATAAVGLNFGFPISMSKVAFITGITGQDGSYLAELLLAKGYTVHGLVRTPRALGRGNLAGLVADPELIDHRLHLHVGTCEDVTTLRRVVHDVRPDEVYHLAAQSSPQLSLDAPVSAMDCIGMSTLHLLEIVRDLRVAPRTLYASSAEIFGVPGTAPQDELTPINPVTPYGAAKAFGHHIARIYRDAHRLPVSSVIFFNHESPRRDEMFVTRKITRAAGRIRAGLQGELALGDLTARRDWGYARDYVELMWRALQHDEPGEYVAATGETHTVGEFVEACFGRLGLDWRQHVRHATPQLLRARDSRSLVGDARRAREVLGWEPRTRFAELVAIMADADAELAAREAAAGGGRLG